MRARLLRILCRGSRAQTVFAGIAQLVERNLAKVEVASSNLVSRSMLRRMEKRKHRAMGYFCRNFWRDGRVVMQRPAKPWTPVRFRLPPPFVPACLMTGVRPGGGIGRHGGSRILCLHRRAGSIPAPGTILMFGGVFRPDGGTGRHRGLKIPCPFGRAGSIPAPGTVSG